MEPVDVVRDAIKAVPEVSEIPRFAQMLAHTQSIALRYPDLVTVTRVGVSCQGTPIDMISIGDGPGSALFVGAPHPNEVIGCLLIEHLLERLCSDPGLRQVLGYRCHFIKAIEPDALRLNEGWFDAPGDLRRYYENYYRPPLDQQAEYAFPFGNDDRWTRHPMPENLAWRTAIELARPDFLCSLHNAEFGGAHFLTSAMPDGLATTLTTLCRRYGLTLNPVGDTALNEHPWAPGLFRFPDMKAVVSRHRGPVNEPGTRPVGNSSAGYTAAAGTFSFIAEVPYWDCARLHDATLSPHRRSDLDAERDAFNREVLTLAQRVLTLDLCRSNRAAVNMWQVLRSHADGLAGAAHVGSTDPEPGTKLTWSEYTLNGVSGHLEHMSTLGLARQVALASLDRGEGFELAARCQDTLSHRIDILTGTHQLRPVPLTQLVQLQLHTALAAMTAVNNRSTPRGTGAPSRGVDRGRVEAP